MHLPLKFPSLLPFRRRKNDDQFDSPLPIPSMTSLEGHPYTKYLLVEPVRESGIVTFASMNCTVRKKESRHFRREKTKEDITLNPNPQSTSQRDRRRRRPLGRWKEEAGGDRGMEVVEEKMVGFGKERLHRGGGKGECVVLSLHLLFPSLSSAEKNPGFLLFLFRSSARERERRATLQRPRRSSSSSSSSSSSCQTALSSSCPSPVHLRS